MRKGIGKALVEYVAQRTKRPLTIEVLAGNVPALGLYQSMGFSVSRTSLDKMPGSESFKGKNWLIAWRRKKKDAFKASFF